MRTQKYIISKDLINNWFPEYGNGNKRGWLTGQIPKAMGLKFDLFYFLVYVDKGAMIFDNRKYNEEGTKLIMDHFARFGLEMHVGHGDKAPKTKCVYFLAFKMNTKMPTPAISR
jgi:hypothetical protein